MSNSSVNFTTPGASTNSTTESTMTLNSLEICILGINVLFGLPTHSYVIWLIFTGRGNVASEFFILNLSVCELGGCLSSLFSILNDRVWFSRVGLLTLFLVGLSVTGRPLFQCLICVERYLAVVHPVTFLKYKPLRYRVICCSVVWIIVLGSCLACIFIVFLLDTYVWFFLLQFLLFLSIQLFCLVSVLRALKQSGPGERKREEENHMKRRAFNVILITTVTMLITYVPFIISGLSFILTQRFNRNSFNFSLFCNIIAGFIQPVLHLYRSGKLSCLCSFFQLTFTQKF